MFHNWIFWSHFFFYGKTWDGKKYPFEVVPGLCPGCCRVVQGMCRVQRVVSGLCGGCAELCWGYAGLCHFLPGLCQGMGQDQQVVSGLCCGCAELCWGCDAMCHGFAMVLPGFCKGWAGVLLFFFSFSLMLMLCWVFAEARIFLLGYMYMSLFLKIFCSFHRAYGWSEMFLLVFVAHLNGSSVKERKKEKI